MNKILILLLIIILIPIKTGGKIIGYCKSEKEVKDLIKDWVEDGRDTETMQVIRVRKISNVKTQIQIVKAKIVF